MFFEQEIDVTKTFPILEKLRADHDIPVTFLHLLILAGAKTIAERPRLNRFVAGRRLYQRRGIWISFSAKREKSDDGAAVVIKRKIDPAASLGDVVVATRQSVDAERSGKATYIDKELGLFLALPTLLLTFATKCVRWLDAGGWLPRGFIDNDPLFASFFIANLGSIGMDAGFHHLFEYGSVTTFCTAAHAKEVVRPDPNSSDPRAIVRRRVVMLRYSFDERVEDGLYAAQSLEVMRNALEDPETFLNLSLDAAKSLSASTP